MKKRNKLPYFRFVSINRPIKRYYRYVFVKEPEFWYNRKSIEVRIEFDERCDDGNVANLIVKEHNPIYKRMDRWMPGSIVNFDGIIDVLQRSDGLHNGVVDYYISVNRVKSSHKKSNILAGNSGLVFL